MTLEFVKLANRWFIDLPNWIGDINDLEMVDGADTLLNEISHHDKRVVLEVATSSNKQLNRIPLYTLEKIEENSFGATYMVCGESNVKTVWLCNVTLEIFEIFPEEFYIY